jgi:hypothetical protein
MDYLHCAPGYSELKRTKRRFQRATAERQLHCALERIQQLADDPMLCHWLPSAAILFGSMLDPQTTRVGDVDLCEIGRDTALEGLETSEQLITWAPTTDFNSRERERLYSVPRQMASKYIKKQNTLLSLALRDDFEHVGGGRRFPYEIVWTRTGVDAGTLRAQIEAARPAIHASSIKDRLANVQSVLGKQQIEPSDT